MLFELDPNRAAVLVIDFQERLCAAMPPEIVERSAENVRRMLTLAQLMELPVLMSEQYPRGLGATLETVRLAAPEGIEALPKTTFSALRDPTIAGAIEALESSGRDQFILAGIETHICVYQTARDLLSRGRSVVVPEDMVVSRTKANWRRGLKLMAQDGAMISAAEVVFFDLLKEGRGETFKVVSRMIR